MPWIREKRQAQEQAEAVKRAAEAEQKQREAEEKHREAESLRSQAVEAERLTRKALNRSRFFLIHAIFGLVGAVFYAFKAEEAKNSARRTAALADFDLSSLYLDRTKPDWPEVLAHLARGLQTDPENAMLRQSSVLLLTTNSWYFPFTEPLHHGSLLWSASFSPDGV